jgi:two-component system chemotaxis sensor kinase CheA
VRLDADVLSSVQTALVQVVRNAVAHGIEPEAERAAAGKPAAGKVRVEIERRANRAVFRCSDDGRGIDLPAVRRAAARGLSDIEVSRLGDDEVVRLLLKGGISTARTVTPMAGRGVGLDVVREAADRLGGHVAIETAAGRGVTLELAVPISLSSLDALLVDADDRTVAIPLEAIRRIVRLRPQDIARAGDGESILFAGQAIPFAPLAAPLRAGGARDATTPRACSAVIIDAPSGRAALGVTQLRGTETIVVQPLPDAVAADPIVAGAALDAEGNPLLVLHPEALVAAAARTEARERPAPRQRPPVLIVDDSLTTRMLEQSILELAGYDVDLATSGEEALEKAAARRYALFLVDVEMPGMDGFTFVATTQNDPTLREVPAILVTSRDAEEDRARGRAVGAKAYIVKSELDQNDLLERIGKLVA